jgi:hypothetical protein
MDIADWQLLVSNNGRLRTISNQQSAIGNY